MTEENDGNSAYALPDGRSWMMWGVLREPPSGGDPYWTGVGHRHFAAAHGIGDPQRILATLADETDPKPYWCWLPNDEDGMPRHVWSRVSLVESASHTAPRRRRTADEGGSLR